MPSKVLPWQLQADVLRAINRSGLSYEEILGAIKKAADEKRARETEQTADSLQLNMLDANGTDI